MSVTTIFQLFWSRKTEYKTVKIQARDLRLEKGLSIDLCDFKVFEWKLTSIKMTFKQRVVHKICGEYHFEYR